MTHANVADKLYSPRILLGRKNSGDLFHKAPSGLLSFLGICHKSGECPPTPKGRRCRNDLSVRYVQIGACCTVKKKIIQRDAKYKSGSIFNAKTYNPVD